MQCGNKTALFDHLVGAREQCWWHRETECFGGFEIYHELVFGWRLHRQVSRFFSLKYAIDVFAGALERGVLITT